MNRLDVLSILLWKQSTLWNLCSWKCEIWRTH